MTTSRRLAPLALLLIGLAVLAALVLIPWVVHAQTANKSATGQPRVFPSAEDSGVLIADTWGIADGNGLEFVDDDGNATGDNHGDGHFEWSYQWVRVDGGTETNVGVDAQTYRFVEADIGKRIKVEVSFTDDDAFSETVTSLPFGPIAQPVAPSLPSSTLVSNLGSTASATANITKQYAQGFRLGAHGQGYEISSVSIELAAAPSSLTVSLWASSHPELAFSSAAGYKLFDFENPSSFTVGLNRFTAPAGALAYQNVNYFIVLSGFGSSLSIEETTSDDEDSGHETGAILFDKAHVRGLSATGRWSSTITPRASVLRLAVVGSRRTHGVLVANYGQAWDPDPADTTVTGTQEIVSVGDLATIEMTVGAADRYLIRGFSVHSDDTTSTHTIFANPWSLWNESSGSVGTKRFNLINSRSSAGIGLYSAPQGATVEGSAKYYVGIRTSEPRDGAVLGRFFTSESDGVDSPTASGVSYSGSTGDGAWSDGYPFSAVLGVPLHAVVQNLGQTDDGYRSVGGANKVLSQGFTTGSNAFVLQGIGVNIEGSGNNFPDGPTSVSVAVHADSSGQPGAKLFDLVSPTEFAAGHTFFEAPPGTTLEGSTSYVMVWSHLGGTVHRMRKTGSNSEDSGALTGSSMANTFYQGADIDNLAVDPGSDVLEIAVYSRSLPNATGRPVVLASAEDAGILAVDTSRIGDPDGIPNVGAVGATGILYDFSYRWIRVDGDTETVVGADSADYRQIDSGLAAAGVLIESGRYRRVDADIGKLIKVQVSFIDKTGALETVTSLPFGPVPGRPAPLRESTLVSNTGQPASVTAMITGRYDMGFKLGDHGQGYEISSVSIDLAAAPSSLSVSLWMGRAPGSGHAGAYTKLFDFENPDSFKAGLNRFTAPASAFAYQNVGYFIVLSGFGSSLSIKETTSDNEDAGGETGATLGNSAGGDSSVLRLAVKGSQRDRGILASTYAQAPGLQEITSIGDEWGVAINVGAADRYLIRGMSFSGDQTSTGGPFTHPFDLLDGTDELFRLINTRQISGISEWTAPQGATVAGGCTTDAVTMVETCETYNFKAEVTDPDGHRIGGVVLARYFGTESTTEDSPTAAGVSLASPTGDLAIIRLLMAVFGEPLDAMVQNLGQANDGYVSVGGPGLQVASQGFTTGSAEIGHRLQGIGVNINGSDSSFPDGSTSVSVAVHADSNGKPGDKLFDLLSPTEYAPGHSFFEAPPGTILTVNTSYVLVWRHLGGTWHRLVRTSSNSEDSGALSGSSIADAYYLGADLNNLNKPTGNQAMEIVVYTEDLDKAPFVPGGIEVTKSWLHIPEGAEVGDQFRVLFVTHRATKATFGNIKHYNDWVKFEAGQTYSNPIIRAVASQFKAVVCTVAVDARTNTGMPAAGHAGVPIHWLNGGWQDRPTLVANLNSQFYGGEWVNHDWGAYVTGNSAYFHENYMIWTGCDSVGGTHPTGYMGSLTMVAAGTPRDPDKDHAPLGHVDPLNLEFVGAENDANRPLYAISPVFTVVGGE